jgi:integrase
MGRRGNSEGTITKRADGRWEARLSLPDGKRKSFYGRTRREVEHRLADARRDIESGLPVVGETQTLKEYLESWLVMVAPPLRPSSRRRYRTQVMLHLIPGLGHISLSKLTAQQIQLLYAKKMKGGLSSTTVNHMHGVLHHALDDAVRFQLIQRNVSELVRPPRKQVRKESVLSPKQARLFLDAIAGDRYEALYILALTTGMREGELLALHWEDIDWRHQTLQLHLAVQEEEEGRTFSIAEPKTAFSRRRIALTQVAIDALKQHRDRIDAEKVALGEAWDTTYDLVFPNTIGKILRPTSLADRMFPKILKKAGLPKMRFHDLRHTAATLLLRQGVHPKVVSEMLGHSNIRITLNTYSHVTPHMQQQAVDAMESVLKEDSD